MIAKANFMFFALLISAAVKAQTITKEQFAAQQTVEKLFAALSTTDIAALRGYCTNNVKFYEYGQIWTLDTIIQKVMESKAIKDFKRTNKFDFVNTSINKKTAWATYNLQSEITKNGRLQKVHWLETVVLIKENGRWKLTVLHSSLIKRV